MNRVFVEKQPEFNTQARELLHDLRDNLNIHHLEGIRVIQRYDVDGLSEQEFVEASRLILSEPQVDVAFGELILDDNETAFAVEYLPGQYDQRADSAAQCLQILTTKERPAIASASVYVLQGALNQEDVARIKEFIINSVDSHEATLNLPETLHTPTPRPKDVESLTDFNAMDPATACREFGLAMSPADVAFCQKYFGQEEGSAKCKAGQGRIEQQRRCGGGGSALGPGLARESAGGADTSACSRGQEAGRGAARGPTARL